MNKLVYNISKIMSFIAHIILLFIMFLITFDVFGRYFFSKPIKGTFELTELSLSLIVLFGLGITHWYKEHVDINLLIDKLSKKMILIVDAVINALIAIVSFLTFWKLLEYAQRMSVSNTVTGELKIPISIFTILGSLGVLALGLVALHRMISLIKRRLSDGT